MMNRILIVDDDEAIVSVLQKIMKINGLETDAAQSGEKALSMLKEGSYSLLLLDINMHGMDGFEVIRKLRESGVDIPIIVVSGRKDDYDALYGMDLGADDYVTKPFNPVELMARVKSQLRRYTMLGAHNGKMDIVNTDSITIGGIELNDKSKEVTLDGNPVSLTPLEYDILKLLMTRKGEVLSPKDIYENVWKESVLGAESTVAVHIRHLREKLEYDSANPRYLKAVWGHGYKMDGGSI